MPRQPAPDGLIPTAEGFRAPVTLPDWRRPDTVRAQRREMVEDLQFDAAHDGLIWAGMRDEKGTEGDWLRSSAPDLATAIAYAVGNPGGDLAADARLIVSPPRPNLTKVRKLMAQTVKPKHRFLVHLSPFEG